MIHPTAIIDPTAKIPENTHIGPYCVIGAQVALGADCELANHVTIAGPTTIGANNTFYPYASIGQRSQDLKYHGEPTYLEIGNNNSFREFCTVNRGTSPGSKTLVGNHGTFLAYTHIAHDCTIGDHVIFSNNGTIAGHVEVEDFVVLGGLAAVHQFCRLGAHSMVGGCSKIVQDVAPYMIADANPATLRAVNVTGLERRSFSPEEIKKLRKAYRFLCRANLNVAQATEAIRAQLLPSPCIEHLLAFIASSQRGLVR